MALRMRWCEAQGGQALLCDASADGTHRLTLLLPGGRETYFLNGEEAQAAREEYGRDTE